MNENTTLRQAELELRNNRLWFDRMIQAYLGVSLDELICHQKCSECRKKGACRNAESYPYQTAEDRRSDC